MNAQSLIIELKKFLPLKVYVKGPILELLREMGQFVDKKTPLQATDVFRSQESGEIICTLVIGDQRTTAALANLKLEITHPLFRKVRDYRNDVANEVFSSEKKEDKINRSSFRIRDLYKR
tara:strand:- start:408 stop:767 length:360 start_codon:yes stop_codon:yes gene_type:complete